MSSTESSEYVSAEDEVSDFSDSDIEDFINNNIRGLKLEPYQFEPEREPSNYISDEEQKESAIINFFNGEKIRLDL